MTPKPRFLPTLLVVALWSGAMAVLMTWPLARNLSHQVLAAPFYWDAFANTMIMASRVDAATGLGPLSLYDNYFFAPLPDTIVFNENHFGLSLIFAPSYLLSSEPLLAYNLTLLVSLSLSVAFTFLLVRRLSRSGYAGLLAGVAFAFSPYVMFEMGRIQLVATQWIPACFLFLHRAFDEQRNRDIALLWLAYLLQVGTCLYYAMFLGPLLLLLAVLLGVRQRPPARFYARLLSAGAVAGALALALVHPYFHARHAFDLERTLAFASRYDGRLDFFANVPTTNRSLGWLHHRASYRGAYEEIAFPGFTVLLFTSLALGQPVVEMLRRTRASVVCKQLAPWCLALSVAAVLSALAHSFLAGLVIIVATAVWRGRQEAASRPPLLSDRRGSYWWVLGLSVVLFLGLLPFEYGGEPVKGLYYYLHSYFPGFNGIRKVSRQAVMTTFVICVLSGFGSAWLLSRLRGSGPRLATFIGLSSFLCFELRSFPHPVAPVWAGETVPKLLRFAATLPKDHLVAALPQTAGATQFRGDKGMALHNYLAVFHKHRFVNGQSSWMPPATELVRRSLERLPDDAARRVLLGVGARHLLVFGSDLPPHRRGLVRRLAADAEHYTLAFEDGADGVLTLMGADDPAVALLDTPPLPARAQLIPKTALSASASLHAERARMAVDGDRQTRWSTERAQARGQYFEFTSDSPRRVVALELDNPAHTMDGPAAFRVEGALGDEPFKTLVTRPTVQLYREQVVCPKEFVFRLVFDAPPLVDRLRITLEQPLPGYYFSIYEARLYEVAP